MYLFLHIQNYEKELKSYCYTLEGATATTKMQSPKDARSSCALFVISCLLWAYTVKVIDQLNNYIYMCRAMRKPALMTLTTLMEKPSLKWRQHIEVISGIWSLTFKELFMLFKWDFYRHGRRVRGKQTFFLNKLFYCEYECISWLL